MKKAKSCLAIALIPVLVIPAIAAIGLVGGSSDINWNQVAAVAREHPNFTVEQRAAIQQEMRSERHPRWTSLSPTARAQRAVRVAARLLRQLSSSAAAAPAIAPFIGNQTIIRNTSGNFIGLQRQSDCSLSLYEGSYTYLSPTGSGQVAQTTAHFEQVLHGEAGLTTTPDVFAGGCTQSTFGTGSRRAGYLGAAQGGLFVAGSGYDGMGDAVFFDIINPTSSATQSGTLASNSDSSEPETVAITIGDLNGDGLADVISIDGGTGAIHVYLAKANGTLAAPVTYALPGSTTEGATVADVNGDGIPDVVVATRDAGSISTAEHTCVLTWHR